MKKEIKGTSEFFYSNVKINSDILNYTYTAKIEDKDGNILTSSVIGNIYEILSYSKNPTDVITLTVSSLSSTGRLKLLNEADKLIRMKYELDNEISIKDILLSTYNIYLVISDFTDKIKIIGGSIWDFPKRYKGLNYDSIYGWWIDKDDIDDFRAYCDEQHLVYRVIEHQI